VTDGQPRLGAELAEVTKGMVSLHRRFYGKGPTEAKTYAIDDTVICILEGGFTTVERTLIDEKASTRCSRSVAASSAPWSVNSRR
jgi:uncharacterized protein YbcI